MSRKKQRAAKRDCEMSACKIHKPNNNYYTERSIYPNRGFQLRAKNLAVSKSIVNFFPSFLEPKFLAAEIYGRPYNSGLYGRPYITLNLRRMGTMTDPRKLFNVFLEQSPTRK